MSDPLFFKTFPAGTGSAVDLMYRAVNGLFDSVYADIMADKPWLAEQPAIKTAIIPVSALAFGRPEGDTVILLFRNIYRDNWTPPLTHQQDAQREELKNFMTSITGKPYSDEDMAKLTTSDIINTAQANNVAFLGTGVYDNTILNAFIDRNMEEQIGNLRAKGFETPLSTLHMLALRDNLPGALNMLRNKQIPIDIVNQDGRSPAFFCRSTAMFDIFKMFGADFDIKDKFENNALHYYKNFQNGDGAVTMAPDLYGYALKELAKPVIDIGKFYVMQPASVNVTLNSAAIDNGSVASTSRSSHPIQPPRPPETYTPLKPLQPTPN